MAVSVEVEGSVSNEFELAVGLCTEIVTPSKHPDPCVEGANHNNLFPIFEEIDFVQIVDGLFHILAASEVQLFAFVGYGGTVS